MITIKGEIYSSKNHKQLFKNRKTGKMFIAKPKKSLEIEAGLLLQLQSQRKQWMLMIDGKEFPYRVTFDILRGTKRKFDYVNIVQHLCDLMVKAKYLPDDDADHLIPVFQPYEIDRQNPRTLITVQ